MAIDLKNIQKTIGYEFQNVDLLQQAFVRKSYSEEHGGQNNEVLEFIGDKALDLAVIRVMMERFGEITDSKEWTEFKLRNPKYFHTKLDEGKFTDIKKDLVEKKSLARCMDTLGFHTQLIMGNGDIKDNIQEQDSVKEDLFEAILGAVALDCNWNMDIITDVVETMIDFDAYFNDELDLEKNYVAMVQEWAQKKHYALPSYVYKWLEYDNVYECVITIKEIKLNAYGRGTSEAKARMDAAKYAYKKLLDLGLILNKFKEAVGPIEYDRATAQINELVQKKLISAPKYEFEQNFDENGNPLWTCKIYLDEEYYYKNSSSAKKEAQRMCAYDMLCYLMDEDDE